jgi:hypothetical protein
MNAMKQQYNISTRIPKIININSAMMMTDIYIRIKTYYCYHNIHLMTTSSLCVKTILLPFQMFLVCQRMF